jgi:chaperone modulatory protein CbpM
MANSPVIGGELLDESVELSLIEVCRICDTGEDVIVELVREGIVAPTRSAESRWVFSGASVARIQIALRLQQDLQLNLPGAALVIELLEEIDRLRRGLPE